MADFVVEEKKDSDLQKDNKVEKNIEEEGEEDDDDDEGEIDGVSSEDKKKKKKKKKPKKKKSAAGTSQNLSANNDYVPSRSQTARLLTGFNDYYIKLGQTDPPSIPVADLFPSGNFPEGQILPHNKTKYPDPNSSWARMSEEEKR